jgi:hypothetical protein
LTWVVIGSVVALLLCGGVVTASYLAYQRGGEVAPVADEKADPPGAETAPECKDAKDLRAKLIPAAGAESAAPNTATDNDLVVKLHAAFLGVPEPVIKDALNSYRFACGAVRSWSLADGATADVQLLQFANKDEVLNYYLSRVLPIKQATVATNLSYVDGIDEGFVVSRKGSDGRMHAMGFTPKGAIIVVAEIYGKKAPDRAAVGDLLRQQLEKA